MAIVPRAMASGSRAALRRALPGVGVAVALAALVRLVYAPWYGNYDVRYALLWARDILHGHTPDYEAGFAPTPHPLSIAWSAIGLPFGDSAGSVMVMVSLVGLGRSCGSCSGWGPSCSRPGSAPWPASWC